MATLPPSGYAPGCLMKPSVAARMCWTSQLHVYRAVQSTRVTQYSNYSIRTKTVIYYSSTWLRLKYRVG